MIVVVEKLLREVNGLFQVVTELMIEAAIEVMLVVVVMVVMVVADVVQRVEVDIQFEAVGFVASTL